MLFESEDDNTKFLQAFGLLKLIRITRLSRIILYLNWKDDIKISLKLAKLIFFLLLYFHFQGWAWYLLVKQDKKWIPPLDYLVTRDIYNKPIISQYLTSLYYSVWLFTNNDILPVSKETQLLFWSCALFISAIVNANVLGNVAVLVSALSRRTTVFQDKIDTVNTSMKNMRLPEDKQSRIREFIFKTHSTLDAQQEMNSFLSTISPSLKREVTIHMFKSMAIKNSLFRNRNDIWEQFSG